MKPNYESKEFWKAVANRAIRTFFQGMLAVLPATAMITEVNWEVTILTAAFASLVSVVTSCALGIPEAGEE